MTFTSKGANNGRQGQKRQGQEQETHDPETGSEGQKGARQGTEKEGIDEKNHGVPSISMSFSSSQGVTGLASSATSNAIEPHLPDKCLAKVKERAMGDRGNRGDKGSKKDKEKSKKQVSSKKEQKVKKALEKQLKRKV